MKDFSNSPFVNAAGVTQILFEDTDAEKGLVINNLGKCVFRGMISLNSASYGDISKAVENEIVLPENIIRIGSYAFSDCSAITDIQFGSKVETIDEFAFQNCTGLKKLIVPSSVKSMGSQIFNGCTALKELTLPYAATSKEVADSGNTNAYTSVADLFIYAWLSSDNREMDFSDYAIEKITITGGELVPAYAFSNMKGLKEIDLSETNITSIGDYAFWNCTDLESVKIPNTVTSLGSYSYVGNPIKQLPDNGSITTVGSCVFASCQNLGEFTIPESYESLGEYAFQNCKGIKKLVIPPNIISMGGQIFNGCTELIDLTLPYAATSKAVADSGNSNAYTSVADLFMYDWISSDNSGMDFSDYAIEKITITGGEIVPDYAFSGMTTVKEIDLSSSKASSLRSYVFNNCTSLENLKFPSTMKSIGSYAFQNCSSMKEFNLNDGLESIGEAAFHNCTGIHSLTIPETVTSMGSQMLNECYLLETLTLPYAATIKEVADNGNTNAYTSVADLFIYEWLSTDNSEMDFTPYAISKIIITGGEMIPKYAFSGMTTLKEVDIYNSEVSVIAEYAFNDCTSLASVVIPTSIEEIKNNSFRNTNADIYVYNKSCNISDNAFDGEYSGTIYGYSNSTSETFANEHDYKFVALDKEIVIGPKNISMIPGEKYTIKSN